VEAAKVVSEADASSSTEVGTALGLSHHGSYSAVSPLVAPAAPPPQPSLVETDHRIMHMISHHHQSLKQPEEAGERGQAMIPILPSSSNTALFMANPSSSSSNPHHHHHQSSIDEIQRLVEYQQACLSHHVHQHHQQQQQQQLQFQALNSSANTSNSSQFLFSNYLFSPSQQAQALVGNHAGLVPSGSTSLQLPPPGANAGGGAGVGFSDRLWEWNPFPDQPNLSRDHFNNPFK